MDVETIRNRFRAQYYLWALEDAQREVHENFRLLRKVKHSNLSSLLRWLELHSPKEQTEFFTAMIKHGHRKAADMAGETLNPSEKTLIQRSRGIWMSPTKVNTDVLHQRLEGTWRRCSLKKLASSVREHAEPVFGGDIESSGPHGYRYKAEVPGFIIYTSINFGGRLSDMNYFHLISTPSGEKVKHCISLLGWLGIAQTDWRHLTDVDIEPAAKGVVEICAHFLNAAGSLLRKLDEPA